MSVENGQVADAEVVDRSEPGVAVAVRAEPTTLTVTPQATAADLVARLDAIKGAMSQAMVRDIDYGVIPGTGDRPTLLKPGAEKLAALFQLDVQYRLEEAYGPGDHLRANARATVFFAPTGARLGAGEGLCTTRERKYAYRKAERICPDCGAAAVIKGKEEYGGGWLCFAKKGGCKTKWKDDSDQARAFASQDVGDIENPDLPDTWNTVIKMAKKRALVDAVLVVTGASAVFTQDVEDAAQSSDSMPVEASVEMPQETTSPKLSASQRKGVLKEIEKAGQPVDLVLRAVGVDSPEDLHEHHWRLIEPLIWPDGKPGTAV